MADAQLNYTLLDDALEPLLAAPHWYVGFSGCLLYTSDAADE